MCLNLVSKVDVKLKKNIYAAEVLEQMVFEWKTLAPTPLGGGGVYMVIGGIYAAVWAMYMLGKYFLVNESLTCNLL